MLVSMLLFGFLLGLRHALDADHLAAVAAIATRSRSRGELLRLAAGWGTGHTLTILATGVAAVALGTTLPDASGPWLERMIGLVLVVMGLDVLRRAFSKGVHAHLHRHDSGRTHLHLHAHAAPSHEHRHGTTERALAMGTLHGLAGSAALLLLAAPQSQSPGETLAYLASFGLGSMAGMMAFSIALSFPLRLAARAGGSMAGLEGVLGSATLLVGVRILAG